MTQYIKWGADLQQYILSCILTNVTLISTVGGGGEDHNNNIEI